MLMLAAINFCTKGFQQKGVSCSKIIHQAELLRLFNIQSSKVERAYDAPASRCFISLELHAGGLVNKIHRLTCYRKINFVIDPSRPLHLAACVMHVYPMLQSMCIWAVY